MKKSILYFTCLLLFIACAEKEDNTIVSFDLDTTPVPLFATGIVEDYEIVPLETTPDAVIGRIDKVILTENRIYILDWYDSQSVYIFDNNGKYINTISRKGKGHNEYIQLMDILFRVC